MKASSNQPLVAASGFIWEDGLQDSFVPFDCSDCHRGFQLSPVHFWDSWAN